MISKIRNKNKINLNIETYQTYKEKIFMKERYWILKASIKIVKRLKAQYVPKYITKLFYMDNE